MFDHDFYQRNYVANAVQLNDRAYNGDMLKYVKQLRSSGTYENDSALARYYYLPRQEWDELFACSLEGIHQVRSSPDGWNLQMDFYREEVLPAMGADSESRLCGRRFGPRRCAGHHERRGQTGNSAAKRDKPGVFDAMPIHQGTKPFCGGRLFAADRVSEGQSNAGKERIA